MKNILLAGVATVLMFASVASSAEMSGAEIANLSWNAANIDTLRALDKAAVVRLLNHIAESVWGAKPEAFGMEPVNEGDIEEFTWVDLAGDGRYELAMTRVTRCCVYLDIYWQDAPGKFSDQEYQDAGRLGTTIRDLDGDGKRELILYAYLKSDSRRAPLGPSAMWPQVYRLENGSYVDASKDFPRFYDAEVLPQLEKQIRKVRQELAAQQGKTTPDKPLDKVRRSYERQLAALSMEKDKILRVLGRDPNAGLAKAREWMRSSDPQLAADARVVFADIGGHERERSAAEVALKLAMQRLPRKDW